MLQLLIIHTNFSKWTIQYNLQFFFWSEWPVSGRTLAAVGTEVAAVVGTGVAAVVIPPVVLAGMGFTATGVAAGSIAAMLQVCPCKNELENIQYKMIFHFFFYYKLVCWLFNKITQLYLVQELFHVRTSVLLFRLHWFKHETFIFVKKNH